MKAILTTIGKDQVGIIAGVSQFLAEKKINILDVSQTIMDGYFTMMMMVEIKDEKADFAVLSEELNELGTKLGVEIKIRREEIYHAMHQL
ncbi:ACT domain-containing protein [Lactobacillus sp. UCMA15818]|uniref:ACT domain-containing protein n=1 Tax=Lactobacillaceae TaxID=33958 RepID=UPI0025B1807E|nr:ACT domain-containing protein [Lactobacillus sp. UCMA15818]MDN2453289.1 ACT domain-containing protein [Lactobacillus sp. UCMA15818]